MIRFFHGENDFSIKRAVDALYSEFVKEHGAESVQKIDATEVEPSQLIAEIVNINMFAPKRLIVILGAGQNKTTWTSLGENLKRVPEETELIIVEPKPDKRTKTFKDLRPFAREFPAPRQHEIDKFAIDEAQRADVEIKRDAIKELVNRTGGDLWQIATEISKYAALGKVVEVKLVQDLTEANIEASAFIVLDHALAGRRAQMENELKNLRQIEDANKFMGLLASQVFALNAALNADGRSVGEMAKDIGVHPFVMEKMVAAARKIDKREGRAFAKIVAKTDAKMKLSNADDSWVLIEIALAKISH